MVSKLQQTLMQQIEHGEIRMRPKQWFWLQKAALAALLFISLSCSALLIDIGYLWFVIHDPEVYREVGGLVDTHKDMLLLFCLLWIVLFITGVHVYKSIGDNYKKARVSRGLVIGGLVCVLGLIFVLATRNYLLELLLYLL